MISTELKTFFTSLNVFFEMVYICSLVLWIKFHDRKPLFARPRFFAFLLNGIFIVMTPIWTVGIWVIDKMEPTNAQVFLNVVQWASVPLFFHIFLWRGWHLFFIFNLTQARIRSETGGHEDMSQNWFTKHAHWISEKNLIKSYLMANVPLIFVASAMAILLSYYDLRVLQALFFVLAISYVFVFLTLAFIIRKVKDDLFIKKELLLDIITWVFAAAAIFTVVFVVPVEDLPVVEFATFSINCFVFFCWGGVIPLILCAKYTREYLDSSSQSSESSGNRTSKKVMIDFKSMEGMISEPLLKEAFIQFLSKQFKVQYFFFMEQIQGFKTVDIKIMPGKASLIYQKYIKAGSFLQLDLPEGIVAEIEDIVLHEEKLLKGDTIDANFFYKVEDFVLTNLRSLAKEFQSTEEFGKIVSNVQQIHLLNVGLAKDEPANDV